MGDVFEFYKLVVYYYLNDDIYDKVVVIFKQVICFNDQDLILYCDLGEVYYCMGCFKEVVVQYNFVQKIYSNFGDVNSQCDIFECMVCFEFEDFVFCIKFVEYYICVNMCDEVVGFFCYVV